MALAGFDSVADDHDQVENRYDEQEEEPDELILKGTRKEIDRKKIPAKALKTLFLGNSFIFSAHCSLFICHPPLVPCSRICFLLLLFDIN